MRMAQYHPVVLRPRGVYFHHHSIFRLHLVNYPKHTNRLGMGQSAVVMDLVENLQSQKIHHSNHRRLANRCDEFVCVVLLAAYFQSICIVKNSFVSMKHRYISRRQQ